MIAHLRYLRYVIRHKWFVLYAGIRWTKAPLWRLLIHDWSKFRPSEWFPYVDTFYGEHARLKREENDDFRYAVAANRREAAFDRAWLFHINRNPHHWQHWILLEDEGGGKTVYMPERFVREMVADWLGAGRAITGSWDLREWYAKHRDKVTLHSRSRWILEQILKNLGVL